MSPASKIYMIISFLEEYPDLFTKQEIIELLELNEGETNENA